jgi:transposase-like protein
MSETIASETADDVGGQTPEGMLIDVEDLTPAQVKALQSMQYGMNFSQVARAAGVARQTLHQWRHHHEGFKAAMAKMQEATISNVQNRMISMTQEALDAVGDAITNGNAWIALEMLRAMRCFPSRPPETKNEQPAEKASKIAKGE